MLVLYQQGPSRALPQLTCCAYKLDVLFKKHKTTCCVLLVRENVHKTIFHEELREKLTSKIRKGTLLLGQYSHCSFIRLIIL